MCCKTFTIRELDKPEGKWCQHCDKGKGCAIYGRRPDACRSFECLWLTSPTMPDNFRPDKVKIVMSYKQALGTVTLFLDPVYPRAHKKAHVAKMLQSMQRSGLNVEAVMTKTY